jgi:spore germination cell wall hydrolase CwlJ-like protein
MSSKLRKARAIAVSAMIIATLASASSILAEPNSSPTGVNPASAGGLVQIPSQGQVQEQPLRSLPEVQIEQKREIPTEVPSEIQAPEAESPRATTLTALVSAMPQPSELPRELNCLAGAIYFEAKSESLSGQLAVGRVVVARSKSGRFPNSYCGVVFQPSQFSFVRGGTMPGIARSSRQWRNAVAIAQIAHEGSWRSPVEGALYFHAARVSPAWRMHRIAQVENHVFYR